MIELVVTRNEDRSGAVSYRVSPTAIKIGNEADNGLNILHVETPEEWSGMTVRVQFLSKRTREEYVRVLDTNNTCEIGQPITNENGTLMIEALGENEYLAHTNNVVYTTLDHIDVDGEDVVYTPSQVDEILRNAQQYVNEAGEIVATGTEVIEGLKDETSALNDSARESAESAAESAATAESAKDEAVDIKDQFIDGNKLIEYSSEPTEGKLWFDSDDTDGFYTYTKEEIDELIEPIPGYVQSARESAESASASKEDIIHYKNDAEASAQRAEESAEEAKQDYTELDAKKMELVEIIFDKRNNVLRLNGSVATFTELKALVDDKKKYVVVNYEGNIYYLSWVIEDSIEWANVFVSDGYAWDERIIINDANEVKYTYIKNPKFDDIKVTDVKVDGTSVVTNGVANVPNLLRLDDSGKISVVNKPTSTKWTGNIGVDANGQLILANITDAIIKNRDINTRQFISGATLDYAVKAALTDGRGAAYTDAEKASARERIGVDDLKLIADFTLTEESGVISIDVANKNYTELVITINANRNVTIPFADVYIAANNSLLYGRNADANTTYSRDYLIKKLGGVWIAGYLGSRNSNYFNATGSAFVANNINVDTLNSLEIRGSWNGDRMFPVGCRFLIYAR